MSRDRVNGQPINPELKSKIRDLLIDMRKYVIHHGHLIGECVAWTKLKDMFEVGDEGITKESS